MSTRTAEIPTWTRGAEGRPLDSGVWQKAAATVALLTKHLGPCELVAVLPRRPTRQLSGVITAEIDRPDDPQCRLTPAIKESTR